MRKKITLPACVFLLVMIPIQPPIPGVSARLIRSIGVWNNFDFSRSAEDWSLAAHEFGGKNGLVDLVVAQADASGLVLLPFPFQNAGYLHSSMQTDKVEPYLQEFDSEGLNVILSIQPSKADVPQLLSLLLSRYGHHKSVIGANVDLEWKQSGTPNHVSNQERDMWLSEIKRHGSSLKLFLTYFRDYRSFPEDTTDLVILFDGQGDTQTNLLSQYKQLATHYSSVGIYTGYSSSVPPSYSKIIDAVPSTKYVIHTDDVFSSRRRTKTNQHWGRDTERLLL